jgi:hypothetical protein
VNTPEPGAFDELIKFLDAELAKSNEHRVGSAIQGVFTALDELIALAASPDTRDLVCKENIALGQILTRCQTLCSFAMATKPGPILVRERVNG